MRGARALSLLLASSALVLLAPGWAAAQPPGASRADLLLRRGRAHLHAGDRVSAVGDFREAIGAEPQRAEAYEALGETYRAQGNLAEARAVYLAGLSRAGATAGLALGLSETLLALRRPAEAEAVLDAFLAERPDHLRAWLRLAELARARGAWSRALTAYRAALRLAGEEGAGLSERELADARRYERALGLLAGLDPVRSPAVCARGEASPGGSELRRALAGCGD